MLRNSLFYWQRQVYCSYFGQVPEDTLENALGGIIGYELLVKFRANFNGLWCSNTFLSHFGSCCSPCLWHQVEQDMGNLKATPAYLQDLFYRNVPEAESDFRYYTTGKKGAQLLHLWLLLKWHQLI